MSWVGKALTWNLAERILFWTRWFFLRQKKDSSSFVSLKTLNEILHQKFFPLFEAGSNKNYLPERWLPHAALAVKLRPDQFKKCAAFLGHASDFVLP